MVLRLIQRASLIVVAGSAMAFLLLLVTPASAQNLARRLILKDGSYQLVTKWELQGDRVHYYSAEREEWEDVPNSMVDWPATDKWEKDRNAGVPTPEANKLDKELEAERQAEELKNPQVAPGLRLPEDGGVQLLDTFQRQPQLVELQQSGGQVNRNTKSNILRAAINPIASAKQTIEVSGTHAKIQAHATLPSIYVNVDQQDQLDSAGTADKDSVTREPERQKVSRADQPQMPWDRFKIVRMQTKGNKRIAGDIKVAVYGKVSQEAKFVPTTAEQLTGGWVKVTPTEPLAPGEYAVVESLGKDGMNLYVWDFGVNPSAAANAMVTKPEASAAKPDPPKDMQKRQ
jgi:hypothetical protein